MGCVLGGVGKVEIKYESHHGYNTQVGSKTISFNVSDKDVGSRH
jgi:hypothetical protein